MTDHSLLKSLLERKDIIFIDNGQLVIKPAGKDPIPAQWMTENQEGLALSIGILCGVNIMKYDNFSTGNYGSIKAGGVTLHFLDLTRDSMSYAIFNVNLKRTRSTIYGKKGTPLPSGKFSVGKRSFFYKFWYQSGLTVPKKLSTFSDRMSLLKDIWFNGDYYFDERLLKDSIRPVNISYEQINNCVCNSVDNSSTMSRQLTDNVSTRTPDKETTKSYTPRTLQAVSTTGDANYGNKIQGTTVIRDNVIPVNDSYRNVTEQSNCEWLKEYESTN